MMTSPVVNENGTASNALSFDPYAEIGVAGVNRSGGYVDDEILNDLRGDRKKTVIRQMMYNDATIGALLFALKMMIRQVDYRIEPASQDNIDLEAAELVRTSIFEDMSTSWKDTLSDIASFLPWGWCLPGDQVILMENGEPRPIADVRVGDMVLTGKGRARRVNRVFTRQYQDDLVSLKVRGYAHPIRLTVEHRVPTNSGWKTAGELVRGETLFRPRPVMREGGDYEAGWIVGVYLAEGHLAKDKRHRVHFSVHRNEGDELAVRIDRFAEDNRLYNRYGDNVTARVSIRKPNSATVTVSNPVIRQMIEEWVSGDRATIKRLNKMPDEIEFARGIWEGWLWGDGHDSTVMRGGREYRIASGTTSSDVLAQQMQLIGGALGYPSPLRRVKIPALSVIRGRVVNTGPSNSVGAMPERFSTFPLRVPEEKREDAKQMRVDGRPWRVIAEKYGVTIAAVRAWLTRERSVSPHGLQCHVRQDVVEHVIESVTRDPYTGIVYDIEVDEDHTFCAGPITVSNCWQETVYKHRDGDSPDPSRRSKYNDGKIGFRKWAIRSQETLSEWVFDDRGGVRAMVQNAPPDYKTYTIPIEKSILFKTENNRGNPEGMSILRTAYRAWRMKTRIENLEGIGLERDLAGMPVALLPSAYMASTATASQKELYNYVKGLVRNIRRDEMEGVVFPSDRDSDGNLLMDIKLMTTGGTRQFNTDTVINRWDQRILMSVLADFMMLGAEQHGSYSLSSDKTDLFAVATGAWLDSMCGVINQHPIPRLIRLNGIKVDKMPMLMHGDIESEDKQAFAESVAKLLTAGALTPDRGLEDTTRQVLALPALVDDETVAVG